VIFSAMLATAFGASLPAHADVVLTFDRETSGSLRPERGGEDAPPANPNAKQSVRVSLKGTNARVEFRPAGAAPETAPTTVLLYDGVAQKVVTLNMAAKTYYVESYKEAIDGERKAPADNGGNAGGGGFASRMTFSGGVDLKAARANNDYVSKEIGGVSNRQYLVTGSVAMQFNAPPGGAMNGAPGGNGGGVPGGNAGGAMGGGNPNGGNGGGATPNGGMGQGGGFGGRQRRNGGQGGQPGGGGFTPPSLGVTGEVWYSDGTALFAAGRDTPVAAVYRLMLPDNAGPFGGSLTKPLVTQLKNRKSLPGESTISLKMSAGFARPGGEAAPEPTPLTTHLTVKETKTDAVLEDALFALPTDFKLVDPPAQNFGGRGGRQGGGNRRRGGNNAPTEGTINE